MITLPELKAASKGTLVAADVSQDSVGGPCRHHTLLLTCESDSAGAFEVVIPLLNGWLRAQWIKGLDAGPGALTDGATLEVKAQFHDALVLGTLATSTVSANVGQTGASGDTATATATTCLASPCKVTVAGCGGVKRFLVLLLLKIGA